MTRSYKKTPVCKGNSGSKFMKDYYNRSVRRKLKNHKYHMANGNEYRKMNESYNIHDYKSYYSKENYIAELGNLNRYRREQYDTAEKYQSYLERLEMNWYRYYYRK